MKTIEINLYEFDELSEEAQQKAIENLYDINVDYDWWQFHYEDAERIGIKIIGFDIDRGDYCEVKELLTPLEIAANILKEHGENCDTYKLAKTFLEEHAPIFSDYMNEDSENYESGDLEDDLLCLESKFIEDLSECYLQILRGGYEWRTEEKQIIETIKSNEYHFTEDGKLRNF